MNTRIRNTKRVLSLLKSLSPYEIVNNVRGLIWFNSCYRRFKRQLPSDNKFDMDLINPFVADRFESGGTAKGHYFHQDLHVAKLIFDSNPKKHVDISSRVDGFVAHVPVFREIEVLDIRPLNNKFSNIRFKQGEVMSLPHNMSNYCDSISSLHAIEHFDLGRYGDPIDYYGHLKAIQNITTMLKPKGVFYFSVPIGP